MPESRFRSDRATMLAVAAALVVAAAVVLLASWRTEAAAAARPVAVVLALVAGGLFAWATLARRAEAGRRAALDKTVDDELGRKWGFAAAVGAFDKPWYVLCGEPGVGKTAALRAGRLPMALGPDGQPVTDAEQGKQGTYLFDWWFFQDAVVLDSAGDLIAQADDRWSSFLGRVRDARPDRPVNGMLLAVSAADLIAGDVEQLQAKAALLARQVRVARQELRVRFPLYLLVTKADLITGFGDFFPTGSDLRASFQILGWSDERDPRRDDAPVAPADVRRGLDGMVADLRRRRTAVESHTTTGRPDAEHRLDHLDEMFAFPASAAAAMDNLGPFVAALLEQVTAPDAEQGSAPVAPPFFRGVYLTSALRTGEALDAELAKAFGMDLRPTARRAASDRAFFIRDLLLEKIVPEAGMVAPLVTISAAAGRRSRLIAAAAGLAALVVVTVTLVGYQRTVSRAKADRDFWDALAVVPPDQLPARLALFDPAGHYRGATPFGGRTLLATYERSADLAATDTASPLLPASATLNRDRVAAHVDLFRQLALAPALVPGPYSTGGLPPEKAAAVVLGVLEDTRGDHPVPVLTLRADAAALVPLRADTADRSRVQAVLAGGVPVALTPAGEPASAVALSAAQRRRIADGVVAWVQADLADRRRAAAAVVADAVKTTHDVAALAEVVAAFQQAVLTAAAPEDLVEPIRAFDRATAAHPVALTAAAAVDRRTILAALRPPPELALVGAALSKLGDADADCRRGLAAAMLAYNDFLDGQRAAITAGSATSDAMAAVARDHLRAVDGHGTPLILARARWFRSTAERARDAVASATGRPALVDPPAVTIPPRLQLLESDADARRHSFDALADADGLRERDADVRCATHLFDLTDRAARDAVWTDARPAAGAPLWPVADAAPSAETLVGWIAAQSATELALRERPPTNGAAARAWVDASHAQLEQVARTQMDAWTADADRQVGPPVRTWADVGRLVDGGPAVTAVAAVASRVQFDRDGMAVLRRQDLFPALAQAAGAWSQATDAALSPEASGHYEGIREFLAKHGFGHDSVDAVRAGLVSDPSALDALGRLSGDEPRSAIERFWRDALGRAVSLLSDAARRQTVAVLRDLRADVAGKYPLSADGGGAWDGTVDARLTAGLALGAAADGGADHPLVREIQGLDVVTPAWQRYLSTLRDVVAFAQRPPQAWTVTFHPAAGASDDAWAGVAAGPTTAGEPTGWHPFGQHRVVPVGWPAIEGGLSVRLSRDPGQSVPAMADLARPWALYRLAVAPGGAAFTDDAVLVVLRLDRHGDPAVPVTPANVPPVP